MINLKSPLPLVLAITFAFCLFGSTVSANPEIPGQTDDRTVAIVGATLHPISSAAIENGTILIKAGRIVGLGANLKPPKGSLIIEAKGKHVYPGMFDAYSNLGLVEVNAVRSTVDYRETGTFNPNVKAHVSVNPDSELIPVTRANGVLLTMTAPQGGLISGKPAVLQLDGWTFEDLTVRAEVGMIVNWPQMAPVGAWWDKKAAQQRIDSRRESLARLEKIFDDAKEYRRIKSAKPDLPVDIRWEAMIPVLAGEMPLIIRADGLAEIQAAVAFTQRRQLKMILLGGYDAGECAALLKRYDIPVIVAAVYRLPRRRADAYDQAFTLPERLRKAGVRFCISSSGRFGASNVRNLPYHAAMSCAFGLPQDVAMRAITQYPAEILGVGDRVGTLEAGKDATLIITNGTPLETATRVEAAFIAGAPVKLDDRHKRLYRKYRERLQRLK
jgi:imidazolonepropionase-like amidohydrolase